MGREIEYGLFEQRDFEQFHFHLGDETRYLNNLIRNNALSTQGMMAGFEIEAWLVDRNMQPVPDNEAFLKRINSPLASAELARFNIELNNKPVTLTGRALGSLSQGLEQIVGSVLQAAKDMNLGLLMIRTLPTLHQNRLTLRNMSNLNRFRALNEQIFHAREGKPIHIDIGGHEQLNLEH